MARHAWAQCSSPSSYVDYSNLSVEVNSQFDAGFAMSRRMMLYSVALQLVAAIAIAIAIARDQPQKPLSEGLANKPHSRPTIIFFLTDDQDVHLDSLAYQPYVHRHLIDQGLTFNRHFCTVALCCPSRVNLWTGKAAHNTNVTDINPPYGGYPKFISQGLNRHYLPIWLQEAGYQTYYTGKLFNAHTVENYNTPFPAGWNGSDFLLDPYTYSYLNSTWQRNQDTPVSHEGEYTTDVLSRKAKGFFLDAIKVDAPFFLAIAPVAPHSNVEVRGGNLVGPETSFTVTPPVAAARHQHLFNNVRIPRTPHFNPEEASGVNWIRRLPRQSAAQVDYNDEFYRSRLRALQPIDELVEDTFKLLDEHNLLDNTYIIYSADNGYHIGQHRLPPGKECGYEEDVNVPFIVRGPGVPKGVTTDQVTSHTDIVPTILELIGADLRDDLDGASIALKEAMVPRPGVARSEHVNLEYWGFALAEGKYGFVEGQPQQRLVRNNTYKALRVIAQDYNLYYSVWCTNEHELYDLSTDPYQFHNIHPSTDTAKAGETIGARKTILGLPIAKLVSRLDALLLVLKSCKGASCVKPWHVLHPKGDVVNLRDALDPAFDYYYESAQVKLEFSRCEQGHILDAEGPQQALVYRDGLMWSEWT